MRTRLAVSVTIVAAALALAGPAAAQNFVVLPFRTLGIAVDDASVSRDILVDEMRIRGALVRGLGADAGVPAGAGGCDDPECASTLGGGLGANRVVFGSLSRLGNKILVRVNVITPGAEGPDYTDRFSVYSVEELDRVMARAADGIVAGRATSDVATIDTVVPEETEAPLRRTARKGMGVRAGVLFPAGGSYGGADRLSSLQFAHRYEGRDFFIQTTVLTGVLWGEGNIEWTPFDIFAARVVGIGDAATYVGGGVGLRTLRVEERYRTGERGYSYYAMKEETVTTVSFDVAAGIMALRTYDMNIVAELRYHYVAADFDEVDGKGAHGLMLVFGAGR